MRAIANARKSVFLKCPYCQAFYVEGQPHLQNCEKREKKLEVVHVLSELPLPIIPQKKKTHKPRGSKSAPVMVVAPLSKELVELVESIDLAVEESQAKF